MFTKPHTTQIIAHRGSKGTRPENTLLAFEAAIDAGTDGIETDVHRCADGHLVIIHDETVDRTTNGTGYVRDLTLAQLKALDAGSSFDPAFAGAQIPTLDEVMTLLEQRQFHGLFNLELKTNKIAYPGIEAQVATYFDHHPVDCHLVFSSFRAKSITTLQQYLPDVEYAKLFSTAGKQAASMVRHHTVSGIHPDIRWVKAHRLWLPRLTMRPWTVNNPDDMLYCFRHHFAGIITDFPARAVAIRHTFEEGQR